MLYYPVDSDGCDSFCDEFVKKFLVSDCLRDSMDHRFWSSILLGRKSERFRRRVIGPQLAGSEGWKLEFLCSFLYSDKSPFRFALQENWGEGVYRTEGTSSLNIRLCLLKRTTTEAAAAVADV